MKKFISRITWPVYFILLIFLASSGFISYLDASSILKDHTEVDAPIELVDTSSRTKRGHTSTTYEFIYSYNAGGKDYSAEYSAVNEKGEKYLDQPVIKIAYSNTDPEKVGALHVLERQSRLGGLIKRLLIVAAILGVIFLFIYSWAMPEPEDEETSEESAGQ